MSLPTPGHAKMVSVTVVFTMNIVGDRVREALNPRLQK